MALGSRAKSWTPYSSLAVCPNRACPIFLTSIRTVPFMRMRAHIVDNFETLILRLLVDISSVGFFCYILTYTAVGNPCASISCFPVTFVREEGESPFFILGGNQTKSLRHRHRFHPSFVPCVFIEAHGSFIFRTPSAGTRIPPSLPWPYFACQRPNGRRALSRLKSKCGQISWRVFVGIGGKAPQFFQV